MNKAIKIIAILMLITGLGLFFYPITLRYYFNHTAEKNINNFIDLRKEIQPESNTSENVLPYSELREAMIGYNQQLWENKQSGLIDQLSYEKPDFNLSDYGIDSEILGYISIPSIDVELPVYNGASKENMAKGAAYLAHTSLPVGGNNTNCVIAAHTRWKGVHIFKKITELRAGDKIYFTNLWETLVYQVVETKIIDPTDSQNIYIQEGRQLLTLSTCHPYPDNYQRYLVFAELTDSYA